MTETTAPAWAAARMVRAVAEAVVGIVARFGQSAPASEAAFDDLVDAVTVMYLRLMGI